MGAGRTVKGGIELVETFLKELNKPAKAAVKVTVAAPQDQALRLAQQRAALPPAQGGLGLPANNTPEQRAKAMNALDWFHGTERLDRVLEKKNLDPKRATSGPMPFGTTDPILASNYAMNKADTSLSATDAGDLKDYFQVFPKFMGLRGTIPYSVQNVWHTLPNEKKAEILNKAKRVGYEDFGSSEGPLTLHPEGVNAMNVSDDTWNYYLNKESKGNPLAALQKIWADSGTLYNQEEKLADIYKLAGFPYEISQTNAPWTSAKGVVTGKAIITNPLDTSNIEELKSKVFPFLEEKFRNDRTKTKAHGADQWDKNTRFSPKEWVSNLGKDLESGENSHVWTSIPDKITSALREAGYNGIIDISGKGGGAKQEVVIPFDPEQLRSRFAAFDPWRRDAATAAAFGVAAPDLLAKEQEKAQGGEVHMLRGGAMPKKTTVMQDIQSLGDPAMALFDALAGGLRGTAVTAGGFYGDIEDLARKYGKGIPGNVIRAIPTREGKQTLLPTVEELNAILPPVVPKGASRSPQVAQAYNDLGVANPLAPTAIAAVKPVVKAVAPVIKDLARSEPAYKLMNKVAAATGAAPINIRAYQGSPHLYAPTAGNPLGALDPNKIGTGEGAQAYGYGHYLAQNKGVGEGFRTSVSGQHGKQMTIAGRPVDEYYIGLENAANELPPAEARNQYDKAALIEMLGFNNAPSEVLSYARDMEYSPAVIDWFEKSIMPQIKMPGHLYTHDLSDEAIAKMLDYDRPLSEQPHIIQAIDKHYDPDVFLQQLNLSPESTGGELQSALQGPRTAERMRLASETLRSKFGIPGVKYLDQGSKARQAMGAEGGTRNFVLFPGEESASTIIKREKKGGAIRSGDGEITIDEFLSKQGY